MKTQLVIIQPTSFCNINCRYCYLPHRSSTKRMHFETLSQVFNRLFTSPFVSDEVTIVWHASEPLVLPMKFYEQAIQLIDQWNTKGVRVTNSFQTNATLITQQWCEFFKLHNIQIGVSLDGPQHVHDTNRVDRAGRGTFDRVMRGVKLLQANEIKFSVIAVVTKNSLQYPDEIWSFFMDVRPTRLGLNPEESEGVNEISTLQTDEDIKQYKEFFRRILTLGAQTQDPIVVRESDFLLDHIKHSSYKIRSQTNIPSTIFSFDCDGNISTFSPEMLTMTHPLYKNFLFGNVFKDTLEDIFTHQKFIEINKQVQHGIYKCQQTCDYFMLCGGGFPANKIFENGTFDSTETKACRLRVKATADAMLDHLEEVYDIPLEHDVIG